MEVLWMDENNNLAALVSTDAEFDHFEAVRDDYEPALATFVASAAHDEMAALTELSTSAAGTPHRNLRLCRRNRDRRNRQSADRRMQPL